MQKYPIYGKWIPQRSLLRVLVAALLTAVVAFFIDFMYLQIILGGLALWLLVLFVNLEYSVYLVNKNNAEFVKQSAGLVIEKIECPNNCNILDIGTGSGILAIMAAKKIPGSRIYAIDTWGRNQVFSKEICERNAEQEGVSDRVNFIAADAAELPFEDNSFDLIISSYALHSVIKNMRYTAYTEIHRVLKPGGHIVVQDLFIKDFYGDIDEFLKNIRQFGIHAPELINTEGKIKIPGALRYNKIASYTGILYGKKL